MERKMPEDLDDLPFDADTDMEDGLFGLSEQREIKGECTMKLVDFVLVDGLENGKGLDLRFEIVAPSEYAGEVVNARIWPNAKTGRPTPSYSGRDGEPNAFARIQLAMDKKKQLAPGEKLDLRRWISEGRRIRGWVYSQASKSNGRLYPRLEYKTLEPAR